MSIKSNIYKLYVIKSAKWFMLIMPVIVLFYKENGLQMFDVFLLQGIYSVAIVLLEIPSGYLADKWGRKNTMIIGAFLGTFGFIIYSLSFGFWGFLIAEIVLGVGQSFISGSDSALLYDSLKHQDKQNDYMKLEGRVLSVGNFAETIAAIVGGLLASISLRTPFYAQIFVAFMAIPASFMLVEPNRRKMSGNQNIKNILKIVKKSLLTDYKLKWTIFMSAIIGISTLTMAWFVQPFLKDLKFDVFYISLIWAALNLTVGIVTLFAFKVENFIKQKNTLLLIVAGIFLGYFFTAYNYGKISIIFLFMFYAVRGIATPVLKDYINRITTSDIRATVLSVRNFVIRVGFAIVGPALGWFTDVYTLKISLFISGAIFFVLSFTSLIFFLRNSKT